MLQSFIWRFQRHLNINRSVINTSLCMTQFSLHLTAFKGTARACLFLNSFFDKNKYADVVQHVRDKTLASGNESPPAFLCLHCTNNFIFSGYVRFIMQKKTICTG